MTGLQAWVAHLRGASSIAVDTESDSFHRYREKVCLIQMSANGQDAILDPLHLETLQPLAEVFADPSRTKIFHDAGYDLICLARDFNFVVSNLFDTMLASRLLGCRHFGLAALLKERFGFDADKRLQRSDWAQRPLSAEQLTYAQQDTHFLPELCAMLTTELQACGRLAWAAEDFARLPQTCARLAEREVGPDEHAFWKVQGSRLLLPIQKGRLKSLFMLRDRIASKLDRPAFKVFADWVLIELAKDPPQTLADFEPRRGLRRAGIDKYGAQILAALEQAQAIKGGAPPGSGRRKRSGKLLDPLARDRYEALRAVRRREAAVLGLEPEVGLSNAMLEDLARRPPACVDQVRARPELLGWRGPLFAEALFGALQLSPPVV